MKFYEVNNTENYQISNDKNTIGEYKKYAIMLRKLSKWLPDVLITNICHGYVDWHQICWWHDPDINNIW